MAKSTYSWEDFLKELDGSGLRDQFSDADLKLAQANPDIGMSLLGYKRQYNGTEDKAERARLNNAANALRSSYGGYTGGANGASFLKDPLAPRDFSYKEAPTYQNRYDGRIQELLDAVTNRGDFSYDAEKDPLFSQYRKQYIREGQRASADAMGQAAAMSGGLPSSFAGTAAGQAANYYNAQLTDKIPELEELAYQKYLNAFDMDRAKLSAVQNAEQSDYQKFLNELGQYNSDRSFAYGQFSDQLSREQGDRDAAEERRRYENETAYQREQDDRDRKLAEAQLYAQYGDLSGLKALGVDTSKYEAQLAAANTPRTVYSGSGSGSGSETGGEWISDILRMEQAGVKTGADAYSWSLANGYSATEAKQMQANWEDLHKSEGGEYQNLFDRAAAAGANSYETARAYFLDQGLSLEEANAMAEDFEAGGYGKQNTSQQGNTVKSGSVGLKEPAANASSRDKFLYSFTQSANSGTNLDALAAQLDTAVENGWITAKEAESLKLQAQMNYALFFSGKK